MDAKHLLLSDRRRLGRRLVRARMTLRARRGSALILTLMMTIALAGLATSALYMSDNSRAIATSLDQERDLRYAAEAELQMGKSALNSDPYAVPDSGYRTVQTNAQVVGADNAAIPGVTADMYIGQTSSNTGQFGRFVSVVAVVRNSTGATVVRRLELAQESFAKFAYWSNEETNNGSTIYFNNNDQLWGPVWSNDVIHVGSGGARFHGDVGTAQTVAGANFGTFDMGYSQHQKPITLPSNTTLAALAGYATAGNFNFTAPNSNAVNGAQMRLEFVGRDLDGNGQLNGADEGFLRVYKATNSTTYATAARWVRGDSTWDNCGAAYVFATGDSARFVPLSEHQQPWVKRALLAAPAAANPGLNVSNVTSSNGSTMVQAVMGMPTARCYLGGDPHLRIAEMRGTPTYKADTAASFGATASAVALAGTATTFVASDNYGQWQTWPGVVDSRVASLYPAESHYLFPLYRGLNPGTKGVIYVRGTTGISGQLRGRVTIYATGNVAVLDDLKYVTDPALNLCSDILGVISSNNILIADNALQDPVFKVSGSYKNMDDTKDVFLQGVLMALNTAFGVENYSTGPNNANDCEGLNNGRGCLYLTGGIIQEQRGAVGLSSGEGFTKRYSYDRCALYNPPPYFPTTGRYTDNRYYEIDPSGFSVSALYNALTPGV